jgi:beta-lactam-binding protein with PASTA domain
MTDRPGAADAEHGRILGDGGRPVDGTEAAGTIIQQDPGAGRVAGGTTVTIRPSNGQGIAVPAVSGKPADATR